MDRPFNEGCAIITGGSRGIGKAVAQQLVERGTAVFLVGRHQDTLDATRDELQAIGRGRCFTKVMDLGSGEESAFYALCEQAQQEMGGLNLVLNAAGGATIANALTASWDLWKKDMSVKFWGYLAMMRAAIATMQKNVSSQGVIINVLGVAGKDPNPNLAIASTINGALRAVTKVIADDARSHRIRVVNVNPGATETGLLLEMAQQYAIRWQCSTDEALRRIRDSAGLGRLPTAFDVANLIIFLMSKEAALITGTSVDIDGGAHRGLA